MSSSFEFPELLGGAERSTADALAAADAERAAAVAEAWAAGRAEGLEAARTELRPAAEALVAAVQSLEEERRRLPETVEREAAELALQLAGKVVGTALDVQPELVVEVVRSALRRVTEQQETAVLVNPDDLDEIRTVLDSLAAEAGMPLTVRAERRVHRGGCVLRTQAGEIDARVDEQLDRAREVVEAALAR